MNIRKLNRMIVIGGFVGICVAACNNTQDEPPAMQAADAQPQSPNLLLLIGDDIGVEALASYGVGSDPAVTPELDRLASHGVLFEIVWSQPSCSPTRATIVTGQFGFRNGVGMPSGGPGVDGPLPEPVAPQPGSPPEISEDLSAVLPIFGPWSVAVARQQGRISRSDMLRHGLPDGKIGLAAALKTASPDYSTAAIGKWHLGDVANGWLEHPANLGFDHYSVIPGNGVPSYFSWNENVNGEMLQREGYTADAKLQDALAWIDEQGDAPWFLWYAFNLPHTPFFVPEGQQAIDPADANAENTSSLADSRQSFDLMVGEMDRKIGELLAGIDEGTLDNTIVIFIGDNGSALESIDPPFETLKSKATLYQGGLHVPLIMSGPGVPEDARVDGLVNTSDLFATIIELTGNSNAVGGGEDSVSLVPYLENPARESLREFAYADRFFQRLGISDGDFAIRDQNYKLIGSVARQELYDLRVDPYETNNLLSAALSEEAAAALSDLQSRAGALHASIGQVTPGTESSD